MSACFPRSSCARGLALPNRSWWADVPIFGRRRAANDWHFTHINNLALSGAAIFCIEATHVERSGGSHPGCLGLWDDATKAALKPILASVRKHSKPGGDAASRIAGPMGCEPHALGRRPVIPIAQGAGRRSDIRRPHKESEAPRWRSMRGACPHSQRFVDAARRPTGSASTPSRCHGAHGYLLQPVPVADLHKPHGRICAAGKPHALPLEVLRRRARRVRTTSRSASRCRHRLGRWRLG